MPPVDLDVLGGQVEVRLGAIRLGQRGNRRELLVHLGRCTIRVVRGDFADSTEQHVRGLVLDRLERTDRTAELHADLGVLDRHVEATLRATDLLGRERNRGEIEHQGQHGPPGPVGADEPLWACRRT